MRIIQITFYIITVLMTASCMDNDMMYPKIQAKITKFDVYGQTASTIYSDSRIIRITIPDGTNPDSLKISEFTYTEGATVSGVVSDATGKSIKGLSKDGIIDLSDTLRITLHIYQDYTWKIIAGYKDGDTVSTAKPQLYNMSMDNWTWEDGKAWYPYGSGASDTQKEVWGTANKGTSLLGINTTAPEESFVAVSGSGKKAAKLTSSYALLKFASGNLFNGQFIKLTGLTGAELAWGTPFTSRPKALHGYYCYQGKAIDYTDSDHKNLEGQTDEGEIEIMLTDWDSQFHVISSANQYVDTENDTGIIGFAQIHPSGTSSSYTEFTLPVTYRNDRTPKWVVIVAASSRYGDYFTGGEGSTLYLDELDFEY
ncbi:MAG: PCMD domain-containing protein [Bacteroidales bacterium]|nr:PCMD domain-containing protein [Bacteroidales bacterium]